METKQQFIKRRTKFWFDIINDGSEYSNKESDLKIAKIQAEIEWEESDE